MLTALRVSVCHENSAGSRDVSACCGAVFGYFPSTSNLTADGGYQGPEFHKALTKLLPQLETEIIKRSDQAGGFVVLPRRWVVTVCTMLPSVGLNGHRSSNAEAIGGDGCSLREVQASTSQICHRRLRVIAG